MDIILNPYSGASGDMILAVLFDLCGGLDEANAFIREIAPVRFERSTEKRGGLSFCRVQVVLEEEPHSHTHWCELRELLEQKAITHPSLTDAIGVFELLAKAEAKAHGVEEDDVHFHEVGAYDSIADICGISFLINRLRADGLKRIFTAPLGCGHGVIHAAHGAMSNPAPAMLEILALSGLPCASRDTTQELVTPTAAAIIAHFAKPLPEGYGFRVLASARAVGSQPWHKVPSFFEARLAKTEGEFENVELVETNIDDMTGEELGNLPRILIERGALDAWLENGIGKKGRPMTIVRALCDSDSASAVESAMFEETTTLGVRKMKVRRKVQPRYIATLATSLGDVRVKYELHRIDLAKPEMADVALLAANASLPILEARRIICAEIPELLEQHIKQDGA